MGFSIVAHVRAGADETDNAYLFAFDKPFRADFSQLPPAYHPEEVGFGLARLGRLAAVYRNRERADRNAALCGAKLRIAGEVADQKDFIDKSFPLQVAFPEHFHEFFVPVDFFKPFLTQGLDVSVKGCIALV